MTLTQKVSRAAAAATAEDILDSDPKIIVSDEKENEDDKNSDKKDHDKYIAEWIGQTFKLHTRNEEKKDEDKE